MAEDKRAVEIISLYDTEWEKNANFRKLWQDTADLMFPRESKITTIKTPGSELTGFVYDTTAIVDSKIMADGLCAAIVPSGEPFFKFNIGKNNIGGITEEYEMYLMEATEQLHIDMFASNFLMLFNEAIRSLVTFGTANIFSGWSMDAEGLYYKEYDISLYIILENSKGKVDTCIIKFQYTPRQAKQEWGDNVGEKVKEAYNDPKKQNNDMSFIHIVRPREKRNPFYEDNLNMPFESFCIGVDDKNVIEESGYEEFPYHTPRWTKTTGEIMGRGVGTEILPQVRVTNKIKANLIECGDKHTNPALEVLESFDGEVKVYPGAINVVQEIPSFKAVDRNVAGNYPINEKTLEAEREEIHSAFYRDVFVQLGDLKGDRRTTVEIRQRILEGLRRVGQPVLRIYSELMESLIIRSLRLEIRNGRIPPPPLGLDTFEIEYLGMMANALSSGQARGFQQWAAIGTQFEEYYPGTKDNVNIDEGFRDLGRSLGVKAEHINTEEERDAIRAARAAELQKKQLLEMTQAAAQGYSETTKAPEEGSVAKQLMEVAGG